MARVFSPHPGVTARISGSFDGSSSQASTSSRNENRRSQTADRPRWNTSTTHQFQPTSSIASGGYGRNKRVLQRVQLHAGLQTLPNAAAHRDTRKRPPSLRGSILQAKVRPM